MPNFEINDWQDIASVVTSLSLLFLLASAYFAYQQLRSQAKISAGEITGDILIRFNDSFQRTSALRRNLQARFSKNDQTIHKQEVLQYFYQYWQQREMEWEYFLKGFLSQDLMTRWAENGLKHVLGRRNLSYFEDGVWKEMKSRDVYENEVLKSILLRAESCRAFYQDLLKLGDKISERKWKLEDNNSYEEIKKLVARHHNKLGIPTY